MCSSSALASLAALVIDDLGRGGGSIFPIFLLELL